jgi:predicted component of type VI protein secretion system
MARLVIYSSGAVNQTVELTGRNLRIGRATENDVVLADPTQVVSRFHAELRYEDGHYILLDLNSANGTWVWDHRIQRIVLASGMVAEMGSYRLSLEADTEVTTAPPVSRRPVSEGPTAAEKPVSGPVVVSAPPIPIPSAPPIVSTAPPTRVPSVPPLRAHRAEDSVSTAPRAVTKPVPEDAPTGAGGEGRLALRGWRGKPLTLAGLVLLGFALIAVGIAIGGRFLAGSRAGEAPRPDQTAPATAPAAPAAVSGVPADAPVVPAASSAEKQEVVAPAVSAPPAAVQTPRTAPPPTAARRAAGRPARPQTAGATPPVESRLDAVRVVPGVPRRAGESETEYAARAERIQARYGEARAALQAKDFASAVRMFEGLEREHPDLLDVSARLAESRDGLKASRRAAAEAAMASGAAAEQRGDFVEAQSAYERAVEADPASGADEALRRVRARMKTLGDDAFKRAKTFDALGRTEDAIAQYERAAQLLAPDDPNRKVAKQRLDVLRTGIIK